MLVFITSLFKDTQNASYFFRGVFIGGVLLLFVEFLIIYRFATFLFNPKQPAKPPEDMEDEYGVPEEYFLPPQDSPSLEELYQAPDEYYHPEEWPENIVEFLRTAMTPNEGDVLLPTPKFNIPPKTQPGAPVPVTPATAYIEPPYYAGETESCHWLNCLVHRFFLELRVSEAFKTKLMKKTADKISMKLQGNSFIASVTLTDILLGDHVPKINGIRLLKALTEDLSVMVEGDITYAGGACVAAAVALTSGITIPARIYIEQVTGKVRIRVPANVAPDMLALGFLEDPGVNFRVDTPLTVAQSEFVRDMINNVLGKLVRKVFIEQWVLPAWRVFFLPVLEPSSTASNIRMNAYESSTQRPIPPHRRHIGLSGRQDYLWAHQPETQARLVPGRGLPVPTTHHWDILAGRAFPTSTIVSSSPKELDRLENLLIPVFMMLVREKENSKDESASGDKSPSRKSKMEVEPADVLDESVSRSATVPSNSGGEENKVAEGKESGEKANVNNNSGSIHGEGFQTAGWRTVKNKLGIHVQKKRVSVAGLVSEVSRGFIRIACDPQRVFEILSKSEHFHHVDDTFQGSVLIKQFDERRSVRQMSYQQTKTATKDFIVFQTKKSVLGQHFNDDNTHEAYVVVFRTVAGVRDWEEEPIRPLIAKKSTETLHSSSAESTPPMPTKPPRLQTLLTSPKANIHPLVEKEGVLDDLPTPLTGSPKAGTPPRFATRSLSAAVSVTSTIHNVNVFGYYIEPVPSDPLVSRVTIISQFPQELQRLDVNYNACRKLKAFIEDITAAPTTIPGTIQIPIDRDFRRRRVPSFGAVSVHSQSTPEDNAKRIDKLRNFVGTAAKSYVGNAASYIMKNKHLASWLAPKESPSNSNQSSQSRAGSPFPEIFNNDSDEQETELTVMGGSVSGQDDRDVFEDEDADAGVFGREFELSHHGIQFTHSPPASPRDVLLMENEFDVWRSNDPKENLEIKLLGTTPQTHSNSSSFKNSLPQAESYPSAFNISQGTSSSFKVSTLQETSSSSFKETIGHYAANNVLNTIPDESLTPFEKEEFVERVILGREVSRLEIPFIKESAVDSQLVWEFVALTDASIQFAILFQPASSDLGKSVSSLLMDTGLHQGEKYVLPLVTANTFSRSAKGSIPTRCYPSGTFVLLWDNTSGQKKIAKAIAYKFCMQPLVPNMIPTCFNEVFVGLVSSCISTFDISEHPVFIGNSIEIVLPRKAVFRLPVLIDKKSDGETVIAWEFSTGGFDILFGIQHTSILKEDDGRAADLMATEELSRASSETIRPTPPLPARPKITPDLSSTPTINDILGFEQDTISDPFTTGGETDEISSEIEPDIPPGQNFRPRTNSVPIAIPPRPRSHNRGFDMEDLKETEPENYQFTPDTSGSTPPPKPIRTIVDREVKRKTSIGARLAAAVGKFTEDAIANAVAATSSPQTSTSPNQIPPNPPPRSSTVEKEIIQPVAKCNSQQSTITGRLNVTGRYGMYMFVWDNQISLVSSRTITLKVAVINVKT